MANQLPRYITGVLDQDRTNMLQGLLYGASINIPITDTNAHAETITSTTVDGAGATTAHDWYRNGRFNITNGSPVPTAAITITVTPAAGESVGWRYVDNQTSFDVTITGAAQAGGVTPPTIPAGKGRLIFIGDVSIVPIESDAVAAIADDSITLAKLAGGTPGKYIGFDGSGDPAELDGGGGGGGTAPTQTISTLSGASTAVSIPAGCTHFVATSGALAVSAAATVTVAMKSGVTTRTFDKGVFTHRTTATEEHISALAGTGATLGVYSAAGAVTLFFATRVDAPRDSGKRTTFSGCKLFDIHASTALGADSQGVANAASDDDSIEFAVSAGTLSGIVAFDWYYN